MYRPADTMHGRTGRCRSGRPYRPSRHGHVEVARAFYSVPDRLVDEEARTRWDERLVRAYYQGECVGVYTRTPAGTFSTRDEHRPAHKPARQSAYEANLLSRAERIGPRALDWAKGAIEDRGVRAYRLLRGMISLTRKHPGERVDWGQVLGDTAAAGAILDRFLHNAELIRLQGRSYRMHNRRELRSKQTTETLTGQTE